MAARVRVAVDANEQQREAAGGATLHLLHGLRQMQAPHIPVIPHTWQAWNKERTKIAHNQVVAQYTYKKLPAEEIKVGKKRLQLVLAAHAIASCLGWPSCLQPPCDAHHVMGAPQDDGGAPQDALALAVAKDATAENESAHRSRPATARSTAAEAASDGSLAQNNACRKRKRSITTSL